MSFLRIRFILLPIIMMGSVLGYGQPERWQQAVKYQMDIDFNIKKHQYDGTQRLEFTNNSPDTLYKVFYHLYFNAFQPGSAMDVKSRMIKDPDKRVGDRIAKLDKGEQGWINVESLKMNGKEVSYITEGTILEVTLNEPIMPRSTVVFDMNWKAQVPTQIRRSGRFSKEGIEYSMAQWYPKMCNYDYQGWHANPYVAREFYGIWGDYDVNITIPSDYVIGGTGVLTNADQIGYGYSDAKVEDRPKKQTWKFKATNVHDFMWAADPDYKQVVHKAHDGTILRFFYQPGKNTEPWEQLPAIMDEALKYIELHYGDYPYPSYAFVQGGDGGMEYPMATLITGERNLNSLVGVAIHEWMHSWYQMVLATNEALYPWMDEGFTSYASAEVMNYLMVKKLIPGEPEDNPHLDAVKGYLTFISGGSEEALITHSDHYETNTAYGVGSYTKGEVFLEQLRYIIGEEAFDKTMLQYYNTWKFKHPNANDFIRIAEKASGLELDWFKEYFIHSTKTIDYSVDNIMGKIAIIKRNGSMIMPLDVTVKSKKGKIVKYYIPLDIMRGAKKGDRFFDGFEVVDDWTWTNPTYSLNIGLKADDIEYVKIDVSNRLAETDRENNEYPRPMVPKGMDK
jgi:hypothetical protein